MRQRFPEVADECTALLEQIRELDSQGEMAYRGQSRHWTLRPSVCRPYRECQINNYNMMLTSESALLDKFCAIARDFLSPAERRHLVPKQGHVHFSSTMMVAQHYGLPTRLLDWSFSAWVALYFAVCQDDDADGAVWWLRRDTLRTWLDANWTRLGVERRTSDNQAVFELVSFDLKSPSYVTTVHSIYPFTRMEVQQGLHTFGGRLDEDHCEVLRREVGKDCVGCVQIPKQLKACLLDDLRRYNIHATSLMYARADQIGIALGNDHTVKCKRHADAVAPD